MLPQGPFEVSCHTMPTHTHARLFLVGHVAYSNEQGVQIFPDCTRLETWGVLQVSPFNGALQERQKTVQILGE